MNKKVDIIAGDNLYVKRGARYYPVGENWSGFPSDGIWMVADGTQNCIMQISATPSLPHAWLATAQYQDECMKFIMDEIHEGKWSVQMIAGLAAEFYAAKMSNATISKEIPA